MRFTTSAIYAITSVPGTQYLNYKLTSAIYVYSFLLSLFLPNYLF